jgi:putative acetyltransferase
MKRGPPLTIRSEQPNDAAAIRDLLDAAFGGTAESGLVERLRAGGHLLLALVAVRDETLVGYVAWPRLRIETPDGSFPAVALAPLAVRPACQRRGVGAALTRAGLAQLRERGETLVFVLGDPAYYRRLGFSVQTARAYDSIYAGEHFMALELSTAARKSGRVSYPAPFNSTN